MRNTLFALAFLVSTASAAINPLAVNSARNSSEATIDVFGNASRLSLNVRLDFEAVNSLERQIESDNWDGKLPVPLVRWIVMPNHGSAQISVKQADVSRITGSSVDPLARLTTAEASRFATIGRPQIMRGVRLVPISIARAMKSADDGTIVAKQIEIEVEFTNEPGLNEVEYSSPLPADFQNLIGEIVLNPPERFPGRDNPAYSGKMLILRPSTLANQAALNSLTAFANWKRYQGLDVTLTSVNTANLTSSEIRDIIREGFPDDPYDYVVIIGWYYSWRPSLIPDNTLRFPSFTVDGDATINPGDLFYATLDNEGEETEDWLPDVIISRMVAHSPTDLQAVLNRSIMYERDPYLGPEGEEGEWYGRAIHCEDGVDTSAALTPSDHEMAFWVERNLERRGYAVTVVKGNRIETEADERHALEEGVVLATADGYLFGMADTTEDGDWDIAQTGRMHPFVVANPHFYDFPRLYPFFSSGTVNSPNGPIGAVSFSSAHWETETRWMLGGTLRSILHGEEQSIGSYWLAGALGVAANLEVLHPDSISHIERLKRKYAQVLSIGDPTIHPFFAPPKTLTSDLPNRLYPGATAVAFHVTDGEGDPVADAEVSITQDNDVHFVGTTNAAGAVVIGIPDGISEGVVQLYIGKKGYKPIYLVDYEVSYPEVNLVLQNFGLDPDPLENASSSALMLTIENDGEQDGTGLDVAFESDSPFLTFSRDGAALDDIESGSNGGLASAVQLILSPSCPGGTLIQVLLKMSSRDDAWQASFEITTSGPTYQAPLGEVIYQNLLPRAQGTVSPLLENNGDRDGIALVGTLVSLTDHVTVVEAVRNYPALAAGNTARPATPFRVAVDSLFIPGQRAEFELRLTGEGNVSTALRFDTVVSEADSDDPIGPDEYGYYAIDSGDEGWQAAPEFAWIELNPNAERGYDFRGTRLDLDDDASFGGVTTLIDLPFPFTYYGVEYEDLVVCSNGWVSFDTLSIEFTSPNNEGIPGTIAAPDAQLAICWQDLYNHYPWANGIFTYSHEEYGIFIIEWSDLQQEQVTEDSTQFQIILYDPAVYETPTGDGEIVFQYKRYAEVEGNVYQHNFATVGIRSPDGNDGLQYRHAYAYNDQANEIENGFAIKFTTDLERPTGIVRGRFARLEAPQTPLEAVHIQYHGIDAVSAADGSFEFTARAGHYQGVLSSLNHFDDFLLTFDVRPGEVTNLGNLLMVHPEFADLPEQVVTGLQPGFPTRQPVFFRNSGNGTLDYSTRIVHEDGRAATFAILDTFRVGNILGDVSSTSPVFVDSVIFLPRSNGNVYVLTALDLNGQRTGEEIPLPGRDTMETTPVSITWDGTNFWGSFKYLDSPNMIVSFNRQGEVQRRFYPPVHQAEETTLYITYAWGRNSLFAIEPGVEQVLELSLDSLGQVLNQWEFFFPAEELNPSGIGWNRWDSDGMPFYVMEKHYENVADSVRGQRLARMNPETGEYGNWTYVANINRPPQPDRLNFGIAFIPGHRGGNVAMILNESATPRTNDIMKIISIGPFVPYVTSDLIHTPGTVGAGGQGFFTIPFDATGLEEGDYSFGVKIYHDAVGDSAFVRVTLNVNDTNSVGDERDLLPKDFGITRLFPNPFNSRIGIDFKVTLGAKAVVKAYDLSGREVATLFDAVSVGGSERLYWEAKGVPTGLYIIRLESGDRVASHKVALVK